MLDSAKDFQLLTMPVKIPHTDAIPNRLNTDDPTIVPMPMSPSVTNVPTMATKSSGADVAAAKKVAPATSYERWRAVNIELI